MELGKDFIIGVPLKYGEVALVPTYIAEWGYDMPVNTRDNVVVRFIKVEHWDEVNQDLEAKCLNIYNMRFANIEQIWRKRMTTDFGTKWDLVEMRKVDKAVANGDFEVV